MEREAALQKLHEFKTGLLSLVGKYNALRQSLIAKESENENLKREIAERDAVLADFKNSQKISNIVDKLSSKTSDSTELKLTINGYIKEIDQCIAHLEQNL